MAEIVLVTEKEFYRAERSFATVENLTTENLQIVPVPPGEDDLASFVRARSSRAVIVGIERYRGPLYEALGSTGRGRGGAILARFGVGHDSIDKPLAVRHGIVVTNTPGVLDVSVAEHTIWLIGSLARHIGQLDARFRSGDFAPCVGTELSGKTMAVVGFGAIGRRVARMAHFGLGMKVLAVGSRTAAGLERDERLPLGEMLAKQGVSFYSNDIDAIVSQADVVSLHAPSTALTRHLIGADRLAHMKPTAILVNTARGALVDEKALYDALVNGRLAGAALDVFETEPYQPASRGKDLRTLENVLLTPHVGSNTREANDRMARACLENLASFFAGRFEKLSRVGVARESSAVSQSD